MAAPRVGQLPGWILRERCREPFDLLDPEGLAVRPGRELVDLERERQLVLPDDLDEGLAGVTTDFHTAVVEALGHPAHHLLLRDLPDEHVTDLGARLRERRVLLDLLPHEAEHRPGCRSPQIVDDRLDIGRLPATRQAVEVAAAPVDPGYEDESLAREERARVAGRDDVGARDTVLARDEPLDGAGVESRAKAPERDLDLRPVVARDEIDGLELGYGHRRHPRRCDLAFRAHGERTAVRLHDDPPVQVRAEAAHARDGRERGDRLRARMVEGVPLPHRDDGEPRA